MPIITTSRDIPPLLIITTRIVAGLVWLATVIRRLGPEFGDFQSRISAMGEGTTLFPDPIMDFAISNWYVIYVLVISIELFSALSLLTGAFSRAGAFMATVNGFGIGMAGLGLSIIDLLIPWSVAIVTLFLLLFTHPGRYFGLDIRISKMDLPTVFLKLT